MNFSVIWQGLSSGGVIPVMIAAGSILSSLGFARRIARKVGEFFR